MLTEILYGALGAAATSPLVVYLAEKLLLHRLSKDLELYRSKLDSARDLQIEKLRHEFEKSALEHQVTFQQIYSRRHDVLRDVHAALRSTLRHCLSVVTHDGDSSVPAAIEALHGLSQKIEEAEVYLTSRDCERWLTLISDMESAIHRLRSARAPGSGHSIEHRKELLEAVDTHAKAFRSLKQHLVEDMRELVTGLPEKTTK